MPNFTLNGYKFYDVPKNGGTTIRMWAKYHEGGLPQNFDPTGYYSLKGLGLPLLWNQNIIGPRQFFEQGDPTSKRWCITRDPVERFVSAYNDKILNEQLVEWSLDEALEMMSTGEMLKIARATQDGPDKLAACHFLSQSTWLGSERNYFDYIFKISEMNMVRRFCENNIFRRSLPAFHCRNQQLSGTRKIQLSAVHIERLKQIYAADYAIGWC